MHSTLIKIEYEVASRLVGSAVWIEISVSKWVMDSKSSVPSITCVAMDYVDEFCIRPTQSPSPDWSFETRIGWIETCIPYFSGVLPICVNIFN